MYAINSSLNRVREAIAEKVLFGKELTPELIAILLVYFAQGIVGLAQLAIGFFLKDELGLSPASASALIGIGFIPWIIKPIYGFISDSLPIFGYRRRPYLIGSGAIGALAWMMLGTVVQTAGAAVAAMLLSSLSIAVSDVIIDSLVVERARVESQSETGSLQSLCWGSMALGGLFTAYLSGWLLEIVSTRTVFLITASFPPILSGVAWLIAESPTSDRMTWDGVKQQVGQLRNASAQKSIWMPTIFIFIWQISPNTNTVFFFFGTNELGFKPEFYGRVSLAASLAGLVGIWLFQRAFKAVPFRTIFGWSAIISAALGMTALLIVTHANRALGIDDQWFILGDSVILTAMGKIAFMPILVLAARICPSGVEATLFALLMSVYNLGGVLSQQLGAVLTDWLGITQTNFDNLWLLVVIANASTLVPLLFLGWLPTSESETMANSKLRIEN